MEIRGSERVGGEIQIALFDALVKMEVGWWAIQSMESGRGEGPIGIFTVYFLNHEVKEFLAIPMDFVRSFTSVVSHAALILLTSSRALILQVSVNFGLNFLRWILGFVFERLQVLAKRGLVVSFSC